MAREIVENIRKRFHELDPCTNSNYSNFKVVNTDLALTVSFETKTLSGKVIYDLINLNNTKEIVLDTSALIIDNVKVNGAKVDYELKPSKAPFGAPLVIPINSKDLKIEIDFKTTDKCTAIQFIQGDTGPYVFSQCEAIHARSLFPCFDTPAVKSPYKFTGHSPAVVTMSGRPQKSTTANTYLFDQPIPIPSYLVSITSGNLLKAPIGPRSDVYSEEPNLKKCQWEFEKDMENFIKIAEKIVFDYEWSRFDSLVLPSSFPYGGMEIPNMTQLTPTLICGDRTQTKVMAHELAHSWSGNLVTNASWEHFWLNEGWTVYLERRIVGAIAAEEARNEGKKDAEADAYGEQVRHFNMINGWNELTDTCETFDKRYTKLVLDLENGDPDDSFSRIPYEKGFFFLYHLETKLGGIKEFDPFIKYYFNKFKYQSLNTAQFVDALYDFYEPKGKKEVLDSIDWETWLFVSGLPEKPEFDLTLANQVYKLVDKWINYIQNGGELPGDETEHFEGEQDMLFLETLTAKFKTLKVKSETIREFPKIYTKYVESKNGEIISRWNELLITFGKYNSDDSLVQSFAAWLGTVGRMKYVRPGYVLLKNGVSREFAVETFNKYEHTYHPICKTMVKKDLGLD